MFEAMLYIFLIVLLFIAQHTLATNYECDYQMSPCGCSSQPAILPKIINGTSAVQNTWGWTVSLRSGNNHLCGGSILNQWYIITAAHCLEKRMHSLSTITICAGTNRFSGPCSQNRSAQHAINHSEYNNATMENDIALIRVNIPFDFADTSIARICVPNATHHNQYPKVGRSVIAVGWGQTEKGNYSDALKQVTLRVVNKSAYSCRSIVRNHSLQLCAAAPGKDTCRGDSGGPLMFFTAAKRWELIGITSYGVGCAKKHSGVYTRITAFLTFIHTILIDISSTLPTTTCACECPRGFNQGSSYTTEYFAEACVEACIDVSSNPCTSSNTYACLIGTNCVYSDSYEHSTTTSIPQYTCSCECPRGSNQGSSYITEYSAEACVEACKNVSSNLCTSSNIYACLETNCVYSDSYEHSTTTSIPQYTCSCECPRGSNQGSSYTTEYFAEACVEACKNVSSNLCTSSNTYACLGTNCVYSDSYEHSTTTSIRQYTCSCECPRGSDQGSAYTTENSAEACVEACKDLSWNSCTGSNTYACLGTNCAYSIDYSLHKNRTSFEVFTWSDGDRYEGQFKDGKRHGKGKINYNNGNNYTGDWVDDKRTGHGSFISSDGDRYEGQFKDGKSHGNGIMNYADGRKYTGNWMNNKRAGHGVLISSNGDRYEGQFKDGKRHGKGKMNYANGKNYTGDWVDGGRAGHGLFTWSNGDRYMGPFKDNKRHGKGEMNYTNGNNYAGDWVEDGITGHGVFTWSDGDRYEGEFKNSNRHGKGKMKYADGQVKEGMWSNNKFVS